MMSIRAALGVVHVRGTQHLAIQAEPVALGKVVEHQRCDRLPVLQLHRLPLGVRVRVGDARRVRGRRVRRELLEPQHPHGLLRRIHTGAPEHAVHADAHAATRLEHGGQRAQALERRAQVMEHARAVDD
jgi:hypothetical protein